MISFRSDGVPCMDDSKISRLLDGISLEHGSHTRREDGMCAMELVAFIAGEPHNYEPDCASKLLTGFTIRLNDHMRPSERRDLKLFLPRMVGTRAGDERARFEIMARLTVTSLLAPALQCQGATALASELRRRSREPLGDLALWLHDLGKIDADVRLGPIKFYDVRRAFWHAVNAAERAREGDEPNWNWCGGELGLAVADASRLAGDANWAAALQILEAGIDAGADSAAEVSERLTQGFGDPPRQLRQFLPI